MIEVINGARPPAASLYLIGVEQRGPPLVVSAHYLSQARPAILVNAFHHEVVEEVRFRGILGGCWERFCHGNGSRCLVLLR